MTYTTLIQADALSALLGQASKAPLVLDCSFDLADPQAGERSYAAGHIPGARYVHLESALSGPKSGRNGRHPLPQREAIAGLLSALGADDDTQIVAYDSSASMFAARLWWLARWTGHQAVAVLDGGLPAWRAQGLPVVTDAPPAPAKGGFSLRPSLVGTVDYEQVLANIDSGERLVIDARAADRFRGENETLDPIGGHIPGALNRFFRDNLDEQNRFKPAARLREEFAALLGSRAASELVSQCGSGVTACHNLLALEVAGLSGAALYPGSWSEWSAQPGAPIASGA